MRGEGGGEEEREKKKKEGFVRGAALTTHFTICIPAEL